MEEYNSLNNREKYNILFVCLGNICRSPAAEEIFRTKVAEAGLESRFNIDSAGLIDYHEGELPNSTMRRHAAARGYRLTHRSRPVVAEDFDRFDIIVAMDSKNVDGLERLAPSEAACKKIIRMADYLTAHPDFDYIPDPYYGTESLFEKVIDLLEDSCTELLNRLK